MRNTRYGERLKNQLAHVVGTKWVFKIKRKNDHTIDKFRARLVVKGYAQVKGLDYNDLFSPVIRRTVHLCERFCHWLLLRIGALIKWMLGLHSLMVNLMKIYIYF